MKITGIVLLVFTILNFFNTGCTKTSVEVVDSPNIQSSSSKGPAVKVFLMKKNMKILKKPKLRT